nr:hypothetical protein BACY1_15480 [Tenacibaculum mesophilum]
MEENIHIYSEQVKDVLTSPPKAIYRWGNTIILFFIIIIIVLSYVIEYPDIVEGQATLTTTIPPQKEYAKATGKLTNIFVQNNDQVKKGTHLALIENTANYEDVMKLKSIIDTINIGAKNFQFPISKLPILFLGEVESAFSSFESNYLQYELNKNNNEYLYENTNNQYRILQLKIRLKAVEEKKKINKEELTFKKKDLERTKKLFNKGVVAAQTYERKKLNT